MISYCDIVETLSLGLIAASLKCLRAKIPNPHHSNQRLNHIQFFIWPRPNSKNIVVSYKIFKYKIKYLRIKFNFNLSI